MSVVGQVKNVMRSRAGRFDLPGVAMVALLTTTVLAGCLTGLEPAPQDVQVEPDPARDLSAGLLNGVLAASGASRLLQPDANGVPQMPGDLADLMGRVLPEGTERLPLPEPPADEPMVAALGAYAELMGVPTPPLDVLRPAVDALLLDPEAERALAMLLLSYVQTVDLQRQATERLLPHEVELLEQVNPSDPAALDAALEKIDRNLMLQGADLLARAAEAAKDPLGNPPVTAEEIAERRAAAGTTVPDTAATPAASGPASAATDPAQAAWDTLEAILAELDDDRPLPAEDATPTLAEAMASLAAVYGAPVPPLPSLPLSLDHAVASIVHAQAIAATSEDPAQSARQLVATARAAEPTLRAWGAWLAMAQDAAAPAGPDTTAFLTEVLSPSPSPAALVAAGRGRTAPEPIEAPPLSELLASSGMDAATVAAVEASLGPEVSQGLAQLIAAALHVQGAYDTAMAGLPVQQQAALQHEAAIIALLGEPFWSDSEAAAVEALALALSALSANGGLDAMQQAQEEALATVEEAVKGLTEALPSLQVPASHDADPLPHLPGTPSTDSLPGSRPGCVELPLGLSRCADDVLLRREVMGYLVIVTGFGGTDLDPAELGEPDVHIDLGGSDTYRAAMGAVETDRSLKNPFALNVGQYTVDQAFQNALAVSVDLAGDDRYHSTGTVAQGAANGIGSLGVLWDISGNDQYEHEAQERTSYTQGTGARGGVGVLVDSGGVDRYRSIGAGSYAQGVGVQGDLLVGDEESSTTYTHTRRAGAAGILLDTGSGSDWFTAVRGQGHSAGHGNTGLLLDQEGTTTYTATSRSSSWQGGYAATGRLAAGQPTGTVGGLAFLVDLGGAGDQYIGAGDLPNEIFHLPNTDSPRRQDDAAWVDRRTSLATGLDSSLRDEDGDGWSSLAELLAGSDPQDTSSRPSDKDPAEVVALVQELLTKAPADKDADGFTDLVEEGLGSNPDDPSSTPLSIIPLASFADRSLCPGKEPCPMPSGEETWTCRPVARSQHCISLLVLGMAGPDVHDHPAVVRIDLGGNDRYIHTVAGPIEVVMNNPMEQEQFERRETTGSLHIDVGGDDLYQTPDRAGTQGSAPAARTSILLDLAGDDQYEAAADSQGHGVDQGVGLFADLSGHDVYTFYTQGRGEDGRGIFLDGEGQDSYHSVDVAGHAVPPEALASADNKVFSSQGSAESGTGLFAEVGDDLDTYWVPLPDGTPADASRIKNDVVLHRNDGGWFADGISAASRDDDGDGAVGLVEALFNTHPGNEDDDRSTYRVYENPTDLGRTAEAVDDGRPLLDSSWLLGAPGFVIGGRGDSVYTENAPLLIDLGGDDEYLSPKTASAVAEVALLLDILPEEGTGDDEYRATCASVTLDSFSCPSFGSATTGIALLADQGGANRFSTKISLIRTYGLESDKVNVALKGQTQGSGAVGGVGVLATWNAKNYFSVDVEADITQANKNAQIDISLEGISQGAGDSQGIGILASFGSGADQYLFDARVKSSSVTGTILQSALSQGAAKIEAGGGSSVPPKAPPTPAAWTNPNTHINYYTCLLTYLGVLDGPPCEKWPESPDLGAGSMAGPVGLVVDEGGDNEFSASSPRAQGSGRGGILWVGPGSDTYTSTAESQAASAGILIEMGGNDRFLLADADQIGDLAGSQGAGTGSLLLDLGGDDHHDATGWAGAQGFASGTLLDLGGSDSYRAYNQAQGHGGLLLDLTGRDHYFLAAEDNAQGQAYGSGGILLDAGGQDSYEAGGNPSGVAANDGVPVLGGGYRGNDKAWTEQGGYGVDASQLDVATEKLAQTIVGEIGLVVREDSDPASAIVTAPEAGVSDTVHLFATATGPAPVDRIAFLVDNHLLGHGEPVEGSPGTYYLGWRTTGPHLSEDGHYKVVAAAFPASRTGSAGIDLPASHSAEIEVGIDNPPRLQTDMSHAAFSIAVDEELATLEITVSPDLSFPNAKASGEAGSRLPGATVDAVGTNLQTGASFSILSEEYLYAGTTPAEICKKNCNDGWYEIITTATDTAGSTVDATESILFDSKPPRTTILTQAGSGYANAKDSSGRNLIIQLERDDDLGKIGAENTAGIQKTLLVKLPLSGDGDPLYTRLIENPDLTTAGITISDGEDRVRLVAVSSDNLGNEESPCRPGESRYINNNKIGEAGLCYESADVTELVVDFNRPNLFDPQVSIPHVRPGQPVEFRVTALDVGTGVKSVAIQIQDEPPAIMTHEGDGVFVYDGWSEYNKDLLGKDGKLVYAGRESEYFFTVTALDKAGNDRSIVTGGNVIDDLAPRVEPLQTRYFDGDERLEQGRPGTKAMLVARVTDLNPNTIASMQVVGLDDILGEEDDPTPCEPGIDSDFTLWGCEFLLVDTFPEGAHEVRVRVEDKAGNVNDTATLPLIVDAEAVDITDLHYTEVTHDGFTVAWKTSAPATSQVRYGQTPSVNRGTVATTDHVTEHEVEVRGLAPSTEYFFQAVSVSQSGVVSRVGGAADVVETANAFTVEVASLTEGETLQGLVDLDLAVSLLAGSEPVDLKVAYQDAAGKTTPQSLTQRRASDNISVPVETRTIPDGAYRFVVQASRGTDRMTLHSPSFFIDNTPPALSPLEPMAGSISAGAAPTLRLAVVDMAGDLADVAVLVDGTPVASEWNIEEALGVQGGIVTVALAEDLPDGPHEVEVVATDPAGNAGSTTWDFHVDTLPPQVRDARVTRYEPGPLAARPGATVHVRLNATDLSGVAAVVVDGAALGGRDATLAPSGLDSWNGTLRVPSTAPEGSHDLGIVGTDHAGNSGPVGTLHIVVDRTAPTVLGAQTSAPNATAVAVRVRVSEPSTVAVTADGRTFTSDVPATSHLVNVTGLRPNTLYSLGVAATDGAGLMSMATASQRTEPDTGPPSTPAGPSADTREEGVVVLTWQSATDDSGIDAYRVTRTVGGTTETLPTVPGDTLELRDVLPRPVPDQATYHIRAVDLADQTGAAVTITAQVLSLPHLENATLSPERGTTDEPFVAEVLYWSPNGRQADRVELVVGDRRFPLAPEHPDIACLEPCWYTAELTLPATSIQDTGDPRFVAETGGNTTEMLLGWNPVVRSGADGPAVRGDLDAPGPGIPLILFLLLATLATLRTRRRSP